MNSALVRSAGSVAVAAVAIVSTGIVSGATPTATTEWAHLGGDIGSEQYSPLNQINAQNIGRLKLLWYSDLPIPEGMIGNPLVKDGVVYQGGPYGRIVANDLATGKVLWYFDPNLDLSHYVQASAFIASTNRGVAVDENHAYVAGGCTLFAVDRKSGKQVWQSPICNPGEDLGTDAAPRVGGGKVFVGVTNMQSGTDRGYAAGFDGSTGRELWRFYTVPGDPSKPPENPQMALAAKTWGSHYWTHSHGAGGVWEGMIYDPQTGYLIFGAGNPGVDGHEAEFVNQPMLFADSLIAVDATTGQYRWHLQETTGDVYHPGDATAHLQLVDLQINGARRHALMQAAKNGYFYVVDAKSGKLISADLYGVPDTDFEPIDKETGTATYRKGLDFWNFPAGKKELMLPGGWGGHTWELCSYNPSTGLVYIPAFVFPYLLSKQGGRDDMGGFTPGAVDPQYKNHGLLIAYDPVSHEERWSVEHPVTINGGVLSTAGNLVFQGTPGTFYAYDATTGKPLWSYATHGVVVGGPSTVMLNGKQIILVPSGDGEAASSSKMPRLISTSATINAPSRLLAFALDGQAELPAPLHKAINKPPLPRQPKEIAAKGAALFTSQGCAQCHGENLVISGSGRIPDLRNTPEPLFKLMPQILREGMFKSVGMPVFPKLTDEEIASLRAYIVDEAWNAYQRQGQGATSP